MSTSIPLNQIVARIIAPAEWAAMDRQRVAFPADPLPRFLAQPEIAESLRRADRAIAATEVQKWINIAAAMGNREARELATEGFAVADTAER